MTTLRDALGAYKVFAQAENRSQRTIEWIVSSVGYFADFLGPERQDITSITADDLRRFIIALQQKHRFSNHRFNKPRPEKLSPQSVKTYLTAIRSFFGFLKREGFIETNPMEKVKMPKVPEKVVPTFSEKELERLLSQPDKSSDEGFRDYAIMLTFTDTGLRLSELINLKTNDIDHEQNLLRVMGKGSRERFVPFGRKLAKVLMKYQMRHRPEPVEGDYFWLTRDGRQLSPWRVEKLVTMYGQKAGLNRCYPHKLRHTSAVMSLRNGGNVFALQRRLGHRSLTMTRHYSNLSDADVRDQHLKHGVVDGLRL